MDPAMLALLCDPSSQEALVFTAQTDVKHHRQEYLLNPQTGQYFPIRNGIPIFVQNDELHGSNLRNQVTYDRYARFYDISTWLYSCWKGVSTQARLREYLDKLEVQAGDRVLEVSMGTGRKHMKNYP